MFSLRLKNRSHRTHNPRTRRGRSVVPSPEKHALRDASGHDIQPRLGRPGRKIRSLTGAQRSQRRGSFNSVTQCLCEEPSSWFHERLLEPGTLSLLPQTFAAFVGNGRFRICGRIPGPQMRNPKPARPCRRLQHRSARVHVLLPT